MKEKLVHRKTLSKHLLSCRYMMKQNTRRVILEFTRFDSQKKNTKNFLSCDAYEFNPSAAIVYIARVINNYPKMMSTHNLIKIAPRKETQVTTHFLEIRQFLKTNLVKTPFHMNYRAHENYTIILRFNFKYR